MSDLEAAIRDECDRAATPLEAACASLVVFALDLNAYPRRPNGGQLYRRHTRAFSRALHEACGRGAVEALIDSLSSARLDAIASQLLTEFGIAAPCNPVELARRAGLELFPGNRLDGVRIVGDGIIYYDERLPDSAQSMDVAFALAALRRCLAKLGRDDPNERGPTLAQLRELADPKSLLRRDDTIDVVIEWWKDRTDMGKRRLASRRLWTLRARSDASRVDGLDYNVDLNALAAAFGAASRRDRSLKRGPEGAARWITEQVEGGLLQLSDARVPEK